MREVSTDSTAPLSEFERVSEFESATLESETEQSEFDTQHNNEKWLGLLTDSVLPQSTHEGVDLQPLTTKVRMCFSIVI